MDDISLASIKRKNTINRVVFIVLCVLIAFLLVFNVILITNAYFTDSRTTANPSVITTGNVTISYVVKDSENTPIETPIVLSDDALIPGDPIDYSIDVTNDGKNNCYIRMKLKFEVKVDSVWEEVPIVVMNSRTGFSGFEKTETVGAEDVKYLYYGSAVNTANATKTVSFPIRFVVSESEDVELINYTGKQYKITVIIEAIQSTGVTLSQSNTTSGWTDSETGDRITLFD